MNIKIFSRLRSSNRIDATSKIDIDRNNTIVSRLNGPSFKFNKIFKDGDDQNTFRTLCLTPLINGVINGFNTSLLLFGETGSGKSYILAGNDKDRFGIFAAAMRDIFSILETDERFRSCFKVHLRMFEVHNDVLVDLIKPNNSYKMSEDSLIYTPSQGYEIREMSEVEIGSAAQAVVLFRDSWSRKIMYSKNDPDLQVTAIIQIKLFLKNFQEKDKDTLSQMSFVYFPGDECLIQSASDISGEKIRNGIFAVGKLLEELSDPNTKYPSFNQSLLTTLLEDEIGGNCITHALLCLPSGPNPNILAAQLRTLNHLEKVKTCPVVNTENARKLLYCLRLQRKELLNGLIKDLKLRPNNFPLNSETISENLKMTQRENAELRDKVETLHLRLEKMNNRYSHAMMDKSNLSDDFIQSEEDKLRASKKIMDLEIEKTKSKEKLETVKFELSNKILHLEEKVLNLEMENALCKENAKAFKKVNEEKNQLNKQFLNLQKSYENLQFETGLIVSKNKELNLEFVNMMKLKRMASKTDLELNNIVQMNDVYKMDNEKESMRLNQDRRPLSNILSSEDKSLKLRIGKLQDELLQTRQKAQKQLMVTSKSSVDFIVLKEENNQLNMRIKDLKRSLNLIIEEYQHRIKKYATNISSILDNNPNSEKQYKEEIIKLLKRYDSSRIVNENHLKNLLKDSKKQFEYLKKWSERIVYEYMKVRQEIIDGGVKMIDIGPDPLTIMGDYELPKDYLTLANRNNNSRETPNFMELKQQIKEFSNATQSNLEIERAQLLARNAELEEELISAQNYIDMYIKKKQI